MPQGPPLYRLSADLGCQLLARGCSVTTAESCTGGWVAKALTDVAGSSQWFSMGFVTYGNEAKRQLLGVPKTLLARHGAVSEPVVLSMARGALWQSGAQLAVAISGIAGPSGAVPGKPVGTVWFAWARRGPRGVQVWSVRRKFSGSRRAVREASVRVALQRLLTL